MKKFKDICKSWKEKIIEILTPESIVKEELIEKIVHQLHKDFEPHVQNEILFKVVKRLKEERNHDVVNLKMQLNSILDASDKLNNSIISL